MNPFIRWPEAITRCEAQSIPYVIATVIGQQYADTATAALPGRCRERNFFQYLIGFTGQ